jgi:hypothetical protein
LFLYDILLFMSAGIGSLMYWWVVSRINAVLY